METVQPHPEDDFGGAAPSAPLSTGAATASFGPMASGRFAASAGATDPSLAAASSDVTGASMVLGASSGPSAVVASGVWIVEPASPSVAPASQWLLCTQPWTGSHTSVVQASPSSQLPQGEQVAAPLAECEPGAHIAQTVSAVDVQAIDGAEPAPQVLHAVHVPPTPRKDPGAQLVHCFDDPAQVAQLGSHGAQARSAVAVQVLD
ncbi:MAG TPA: hypothetical protein VHJ20_17510 [Polyangia bacterium]|nr:hypothetical protein [Polyangia bacterium]